MMLALSFFTCVLNFCDYANFIYDIGLEGIEAR